MLVDIIIENGNLIYKKQRMLFMKLDYSKRKNLIDYINRFHWVDIQVES